MDRYEDAADKKLQIWLLRMLVVSMNSENSNMWLEIFLESQLGSNPHDMMQLFEVFLQID